MPAEENKTSKSKFNIIWKEFNKPFTKKGKHGIYSKEKDKLPLGRKIFKVYLQQILGLWSLRSGLWTRF